MVLPELLAPAGSYEVFIVAVNAGADAVYISGKQFGARAFAKNFTLDEIEKSVEYAHLNGVKVHVTVNTLINNFEVVKLINYLFKLYKLGVDAIIVQDYGVVNLSKKLIPKLEIHASTQMTLNNYSSILWAIDNGISRIIFPREININQISEVSNKLKEDNKKIQLEVFGHGALCYSISGNCYMSSYNSGRSGNRGACAQPCRRGYKLKYRGYNIGNGFLLSTKDLATYDYIDEIENAGVYSLKLEGRMKSEDYIGTIVNSYRNIIDKNEGNFKEDLHMVFNRQFTKGYILGEKPGNVMGRESSGHQGVYIGDISEVDGEEITIEIKNKKNKIKLETGDGIAFKYKDKIKGIYLDNIIKQDENFIKLKTSRNLRVGDKVYISYSKSTHNQLKKFKNERIKSNTNISLEIHLNDDLKLISKNIIHLKYENIKYTYKSDISFEKALKKPISEEEVKKQLSKTGGTPFKVKNIYIKDFPKDLFIPISKLNQIRREIIEEGKKLLLNSFKPSKKEVKDLKRKIKEFSNEYKNYKNNKKKNKLGISVFIDSIKQLKIISPYNPVKVYFDATYQYNNPKDYFDNIEKLLEDASKISPNSEIVWVLSSFIEEKEAIKCSKIVEKLANKGIPISVMGDFPGMKKIFKCNIYGHHNLNVWNSFSVETLENSGFNGLILSSELSKNEIKKIIEKNRNNKISLEIIAHGNLEVIVTKDDFTNLNDGKNFIISNNSDYATLQDKKRKIFKYKVVFDYNKQSHIINKDCQCLIEDFAEIKEIGLDSVIIDFRLADKNYTSQIMSLYDKALKTNDLEKLKKFKLKINDISQSYVNKGNFINGRLHEKD